MREDLWEADGPSAPPMCDAALDMAQLAALFDDLAGSTRILSVQVKKAAQGQVGDATVTLEQAREWIVNGSVRGVQIRYVWQEREWSDTIMAINGRYRLIRCAYTPTANGATT